MTGDGRFGESLQDESSWRAGGRAQPPDGDRRVPRQPPEPDQEYGAAEPYGQADGYGQPGPGRPGPADPYGPQDPYVPPQHRYGQQDSYDPLTSTGPQDPYAGPDPYRSPQPYAGPDSRPAREPYPSPEPYAAPEPYGTREPRGGYDPQSANGQYDANGHYGQYGPNGQYDANGQYGANGPNGQYDADRRYDADRHDRPPGRPAWPGYDPQDPYRGQDPLDPSVPYVPLEPDDRSRPHGDFRPYEPQPYGRPDSDNLTDPLGGRAPAGPVSSPGSGPGRYGPPDPYGPPGSPNAADPYSATGPQGAVAPYGPPDPYRPADPYGSPGRYGQPPDRGTFPPGDALPPLPGARQAEPPYPAGMPAARPGGPDPATDPSGAALDGPYRWLPPSGIAGPQQPAISGDEDYLRPNGRSGAAPADYGPAGYGPAGPGPDGYGAAGYGAAGYGARGDGADADPGLPAGRDPRYPAGGDPRDLTGGGPGGDPLHPADGDPVPAPERPGRRGRGSRRRSAAGQPAGPPDGKQGLGSPPVTGDGPKGAPGKRDAARDPRISAADRGRGPGRSPGPKPKPKPKRRSGVIAGLIASLVIILALAGGAFYVYRAYQAKYHPPDFTGQGTSTVTVHVPAGATPTSLAPVLYHLGVVASTRAFILAAKANASAELEPGYFTLHKDMNAALAWKLLINPKDQIQSKITIPEGLRVSNVLFTLAKADPAITHAQYARAIKQVAALGLPAYAGGNPQGYLFPDTYSIPPHTTALAVLKQMVAQFKVESGIVNLPAAAKTAEVSQSHIIIVASLVEAEGGNPTDYPKIARVIYNRLNAGMKLQLDSTVLFGLGKYGIQATDQELQSKSPYNTYLHAGLPPGPIDNPGDAAIRAALHPAPGPWLYFVTVNPKTGLTKFTSSPAQFARFQAELRAYEAAHGG